MPRQNACGLQHRRDARAVVVGPWGVAGRVHRIGDAGIQVAGDHHYPAWVAGPPLYRQHIDHLCRRRHAVACNHFGGRRDLQAAAAAGGQRLEPGLHPAPRRTDATRLRSGVREGVAGAETHEPGDGGMQLGGADLARDLAQQQMATGWRRGGGCGKGERDDKADEARR